MRIVLVGQGSLPIPPRGWGAVEHIIWEYAVRLRSRGHQVHIVNSKWRLAALRCALLVRLRKVDVVHVHQSRVLRWLVPMVGKRALIVATCHEPIDIEPDEQTLEDLALCRHHMPLNEGVARLIRSRREGAVVALLKNGTETDRFTTHLFGDGRAVCVGKVQKRKRQRELAKVLWQAGVPCDFVGPQGDDTLEEGTYDLWTEFDRETLRERLGVWSCLVLVSHAEGQALVVAEGLAAGLCVVVSPEAAQNLDTTQPFVFVAHGPEDWAAQTRAAIQANEDLRKQARAYAQAHFDMDAIVKSYVWQLSQWRAGQ